MLGQENMRSQELEGECEHLSRELEGHQRDAELQVERLQRDTELQLYRALEAKRRRWETREEHLRQQLEELQEGVTGQRLPGHH